LSLGLFKKVPTSTKANEIAKLKDESRLNSGSNKKEVLMRIRRPFSIGSEVTWKRSAPKTWHFTITPGPMKVVSVRWDDGRPTEYSMQFGEGGIPRKPGWIITIEYDATSTEYYDPPLSLFFGKDRIEEEVHEMWLQVRS
jgi:hypothetical protein